MSEREIPLRGGRTTAGVVRVGSTVRRPKGRHAPFVHRVLRLLASRGFAGAPRFLGLDAEGREVLSFLPGEVPDELGDFSLEQLVAAARLLRDLHDATADDALTGDDEIVCHGDASPCNCVFVNGIPTAFIDFDAAHTGRRREDFGYAAWLWLDIGNEDVAPHAQGGRLAAFAEGYSVLDFTDVLPAILDAQRAHLRREGITEASRDWAESCLAWTEQNRAALESVFAVESEATRRVSTSRMVSEAAAPSGRAATVPPAAGGGQTGA